jgi:hypothetical protein
LVELLESRLVPSGSSLPYPQGSLEIPPPIAQYQVNSTAGALGQNLPVRRAAEPVDMSGDYGITWSCDAQDYSGWNMYPR